jgi:uncharacterized protein (TIGR03790 family)
MTRSLVALLLLAAPAFALDPKDIIVVANKDVKESLDLADYYVKARKVPKENVVALSLPKVEDIGRADYDAKLAAPLREALKDRKADVKCILTIYGVPLRVGPRVLTAEQKAEADKVRKELADARKELADAEKAKAEPSKLTLLKNSVRQLEQREANLPGDRSVAAVDSELMLLWWDKYPLERWVVNPLYWQLSDENRKTASPVLMTCRLDAPTPDIVKRIIDESIAVEAVGLKGKGYFDARGMKLDATKPGASGTGYEGYDESYRETAALLKSGGLDVTLDDKNDLFAEKSCPDAALYSGWYSHANFKDCCTFTKGAVAWHLASSEATTLRNAKSPVWCPNLLQKGVCATLGPVAEPYTVGFPKPAEFFGFLATGKYTLAEVHARTLLLTSWMTVLVGDPLYNPFAKNPALKEADVFSSPKGVKAFK